LVCDFSDFWRSAELKFPAVQKSHGLTARQVVCFAAAEGANPSTMKFRNFPFVPTNRSDLYNDWRHMRADVDPDGIRLYFGESADRVKLAMSVTREDYQDQIHAANDAYQRTGSPFVIPPRDWNPRRPFGIYAEASAVAVKNARITPHH
jgi:hypothetical protein